MVALLGGLARRPIAGTPGMLPRWRLTRQSVVNTSGAKRHFLTTSSGSTVPSARYWVIGVRWSECCALTGQKQTDNGPTRRSGRIRSGESKWLRAGRMGPRFRPSWHGAPNEGPGQLQDRSTYCSKLWSGAGPGARQSLAGNLARRRQHYSGSKPLATYASLDERMKCPVLRQTRDW